jgi:hypothetical protein
MANRLISVMGTFAKFECALFRERKGRGIVRAK